MDHLRGGVGANGPSFPPPVATSSGLATIAVNPSAAIVGNSESGTTEYKMISQSAPSSPTANVTLPDGQKIIGKHFSMLLRISIRSHDRLSARTVSFSKNTYLNFNECDD